MAREKKEVRNSSHDSTNDENSNNIGTIKILSMANISLWIDSYEDIFSDFDKRPYTERALSEDFLGEARRASRDKPCGEMELRFMMPKKKRDLEAEKTIKKRLNEHFHKHYLITKDKIKKNMRLGSLYIGIGTFVIFVLSYISFFTPDSFLKHFMILILDPCGWFTFWEGLNIIIFKSAEHHQNELEFYDKMSRCDVIFSSDK